MTVTTYHAFVRSLEAAGLRRADRTFRPAGPGRVERIGPVGEGGTAGPTLLNFSSNDYLGLSRHPECIRRAAQWGERWGVGATASRLVCGTLEPHARIEARLARLKSTEAALVLNSGYAANAALLQALLDRQVLGAEPLVFADRLNHASMHEGCRTAGARQIRYRHLDLDHLETLLKQHAGERGPRFILSETVFSMDGDRVDVAGLAGLADRHGAFLYLDEAHATGVLGPDGLGLSAGVPIAEGLVMGTFSKGLGSFGAYAVCTRDLRDYLVNRCAGFIFSTALPPTVLGAVDAALDLLPGLEGERLRLAANADRLRAALAGAGLDTARSSTQIVPVLIGGADEAVAASQALEAEGILGVAIRPPTVPQGTSRIRFALTAAHADADVDLLAETTLRLAGRGWRCQGCR
jgi:8-amino-7-oxononanoate synthase